MTTTSLPGAVLFDFSGTLFHVESAHDALVGALGPEFAHWAPTLHRLGAINGSLEPGELPDDLVDAWRNRDLSAAAHRAAYSGLSRYAGLTDEQAEKVYVRGIGPDAWAPYPDTVEVLTRLRAAGVPVAVVSNTGWDLRPVFAHYRVLDLVDAMVLSYEHEVEKPDPEIFRLACRELGVAPADALMVGDNPVADAGAIAVGSRFVLVPADPAVRPPDALLRAVGLTGAADRESDRSVTPRLES